MKLDSFNEIVSKYKVVFFDSYGVLKNHQGLIPGIHDTIDHLRQHHIDFYLLTNDASRSPAELAQVYIDGGVYITPDKVISSGMIALEYLRYKVSWGTVAYLGTQKSSHYVAQVGLKTISISDVNDDNMNQISALVLLDDEGFDWNVDINKAINLLRKRNIPVVVANTDFTYPVSKNDVALAIGGIGEML
ncbi:MAG: TIGR01459 family HAD-type hydrolase, partial [Bacteroidetes bacterium]|nr:TIGR01459 family HAD-type hydrolase [Bacteroidota bacterium]